MKNLIYIFNYNNYFWVFTTKRILYYKWYLWFIFKNYCVVYQSVLAYNFKIKRGNCLDAAIKFKLLGYHTDKLGDKCIIWLLNQLYTILILYKFI